MKRFFLIVLLLALAYTMTGFGVFLATGIARLYRTK